MSNATVTTNSTFNYLNNNINNNNSTNFMFQNDYNNTNNNIFNNNNNEKKIMLLFVIGGLSFLEIAAFRFLTKDPNFPYKIILSTTKIINGVSFLKSL
jgi:hypothetical protein